MVETGWWGKKVSGFFSDKPKGEKSGRAVQGPGAPVGPPRAGSPTLPTSLGHTQA